MSRCDLTDLLPAQCACPRHRNLPDPEGPPAPALGPWFKAGYPGRCSYCQTEFEPGDRIRADGHAGYRGECCGEDDADE